MYPNATFGRIGAVMTQNWNNSLHRKSGDLSKTRGNYFSRNPVVYQCRGTQNDRLTRPDNSNIRRAVLTPVRVRNK